MEKSWEERMADKARARREARQAIEHEESQKEWDKTQEDYIQEAMANYTKEQAQEEEDYDGPAVACACIGGSLCCWIRAQARARILSE